MIFYISWFIISFLLVIFKSERSNKNIIFVFILFTLVYGCRDYGGVDDLTYISEFENAINGNLVYGVEESFIVTAKFIGALGFNYKVIFFLYAFISFTFMYLAYRELCKNKYEWMVAILGFFVFSFLPTITLMRQFAATSIITYAFILKLRDKNKRSLLFIGLACLVHLGSVIGFVLFPLFSIKLKEKTKVIAPLVCLIIGYFDFFIILLDKLAILIPVKYLGYLDTYANMKPHIGLLHGLLIIIYLLQFVLFIKNNTSTELFDKTIDFLERGQMVYFSMYFITLSNGWMNRLSTYFILFLPFVFKTFITRFPLKRDKQMLYIACFAAYFLLFVYQIINLPYSTNMSNLLPYNGSFEFMQWIYNE